VATSSDAAFFLRDEDVGLPLQAPADCGSTINNRDDKRKEVTIVMISLLLSRV
jgi:hypothetical protein